jgi:universal stress protein A
MSIYKHILLATDLSDESVVVSKKAAALAKLHHAKLSIAHIVEYVPPFYGVGEIAIDIELDTEHKLELEAHKKIKTLAQKLGLEKPTVWILSGDKHEEIVNLVEKHHIDLIVVGSHHQPYLHLLFGGSLPQILLHHLLCDIIVVNLGSL